MTKNKVTTEHGSGVDLEAYFNAVRQLYAAHDAELECTKCGRVMTQLEVEQSEMGNEFNDDTICDECFDAITLEIAKGAFPKVWADDDLTCEVVDCKRAAWNGDYGFEGIWRN